MEFAPGNVWPEPVFVNMLVEPVLMGSPVAMPKTSCGTTCVLAAEVNEAMRRNEPPRFHVCAPVRNVTLSLMPLVGVLRRDVERRL